MSKHRVLSFKPQLRLEGRGQDGQSETEQPDHSVSLGDSITSSTRIRFSVHTTAIVHEISQRDKDAFIFGEGCAGLPRRQTGRDHSLPSGTGRAAPPICSDLIYDRRSGGRYRRRAQLEWQHLPGVPVPKWAWAVGGMISRVQLRRREKS
jgi:hypothetical protein